MRTIDQIITKVDVSRGAPTGRANVGQDPRYSKEYLNELEVITKQQTENNLFVNVTESQVLNRIGKGRVFDCAVPLSSDGAYDKGGAYWGLGPQLRVKYTKDLSYVHFYRVGQ